MSQLQRRDWFPTPIWEFDLENSQYLNQNLLLVIEEEQRKDPQPRRNRKKLHSIPGSWQGHPFW